MGKWAWCGLSLYTLCYGRGLCQPVLTTIPEARLPTVVWLSRHPPLAPLSDLIRLPSQPVSPAPLCPWVREVTDQSLKSQASWTHQFPCASSISAPHSEWQGMSPEIPIPSRNQSKRHKTIRLLVTWQQIMSGESSQRTPSLMKTDHT